MVTFDMTLTFGPCINREYSLEVLIDTQSFLSMGGQTIPFPVGSGTTLPAGTQGLHMQNIMCSH